MQQEAPDRPTEFSDRILVPGRTCWRIERADRFAVIVDAADYFVAMKSSILKAERSVLMIGWDFDTRIKLDPDVRKLDGPSRLGRLLNWIVEKRPQLEIHVLKWDLEILQTLGRGSTPLFILDWITDKRIHFRLDGAHPPAAAHHQKVVVVDDRVAFCGGIDATSGRWDTREHLDRDPHRIRPTTRRRYGPWHDCTTAVEGPVARALGELARERWKRATGEELPAPEVTGDRWPDGVRPTFEDVDVAIARTIPEYEGQEETREIEALYLAAIGATRRALYIESQYFASRRIAEAMAARLSEEDPPEIVVVNPESMEGWLEAEAMGCARARLLQLVRDADRQGRFRIYTPVNQHGHAIYVHAKILVMDDRLLRIGSSNLNNRSLGYDTECDLAVEAARGDDDVRRRIRALRDDLLAEHLGAAPDAVSAAVDAAEGSLIAAIETLGGDGRTLKPFEPPDFGFLGEALAENDLLDPEHAVRRYSKLRRLAGRLKRPLAIFGR